MSALMTVPELALYLNISKPTVYYWVKKGIIPAIKISGSLRFNKEEIDKIIKERSTTASNNITHTTQ